MAIAYFSTWTTYGTWLPGDERGWFQHGQLKSPELMRRFESALRMREGAITLNADQRAIVERTITDHCAIRGWELHAVNCRTNHVHVVVSAAGRPIDVPREQFKTWCSRKLNQLVVVAHLPPRTNWWTQRGWDAYLDDDNALAEAVDYVCNRQGPDRR